MDDLNYRQRRLVWLRHTANELQDGHVDSRRI